MIWLCKICSETREMWKKTGAWFFKSLPDYELPSMRNTNARSSMRELRPRPQRGSMGKLTAKTDDSTSDDDEVDKQMNNSTFLRRIGSLRLATEALSRSASNIADTGCGGNGVSKNNGGGLSTVDHSVTPLLSRKTSPMDIFGSNRQMNTNNDYHNGQSTIDWETESVSACGSSSKRDCNGANSSSGGGSLVRCGSMSSSWSMSETSSGNSSTITTAGQSLMCREPPLGWLEVSLLYSEADHALDCTMTRARDLPPMNSAATADPFCKLNIVTEYGTTKQKKWLATKTVHKTRSPEFNETIRFFGVEPDELGVSTMYIVLLDDDKFGHDFLGAAKIPLGPVSIFRYSLHYFTMP